MSTSALISAQLPEDQEFNQFWSIWRKKVAKAEARKAWEQTKRIRPTHQDLMTAVRMFNNANRQTQLDFWPHASSWLRGMRWEDQLGSPSKPSESLEARSAREKAEYAAGARKIACSPEIARLHLNRMKSILKGASPDRETDDQIEARLEREAIQEEGNQRC